MIKNYIKIAWRNAIRKKQFTLLNILGLTLGVSTCLIIGLYIHSELTYDTFHDKGNRVYRINQSNIWGDLNELISNTGPNVAIAIKEDIPEFQEVTRLLDLGIQTVKYQHGKEEVKSFRENDFVTAEENFFDVFSFKLLEGDPKTVLKEPMSIVMTQKTATRYFGEENPIGKSIEVKESNGLWKTYIVRGLLEDIPNRSHLQFDALFSMNSYKTDLDQNGWTWVWTGFSTYGLVNEGTNINTLAQKLQALPAKWAPLTIKRAFNQTFEEFTSAKEWQLVAQPLREIYISETPKSHLFGPSGNPDSLKLFGVIGLLILVLSSINFMNLSTARSSERAKEIGIRKVLGSKRKALVKQFIVESILFVLISTVFAFVLVQLSLNTFNNIAEKELDMGHYFSNPLFFVSILCFVVLLGTIAGSYPAFFLSAFKPVETLKGKKSKRFGGKGIRNGLIVFQFTISISLIICAFFVQKQLSYTSTLDIGFLKDNILQVHNMEQLGPNADVLKTKLLANPAFRQVGTSYDLPPYIGFGGQFKASGNPESPIIQLNNLRTEPDYLDVLGLKFVKGRNFDMLRSNDKYNIILNEKAVEMLQLESGDPTQASSAIGKKLTLVSGINNEFEIIGVVKDFNYNSLKQDISPLIIVHYQNDNFWDYNVGHSSLAIRLDSDFTKNSENLQSLIATVKQDIETINPSFPFEYSFMDQEFEATFKTERRMGTVLNIFTVLAIIIAVLGLFGLAIFSAEQRILELGIRKVLGATESELIFLFSSEFLKLIGISIIIASPLAYYAIKNWLSNFAYKTPIEFWVFFLAAISVCIITILTISFQAMKVAKANPAKSLRTE